MNAPLPLLLAACVEWLITLRPRNLIANLLKVEPIALEQAIAEIAQPHSSRAALETALAAPQDRPDLIPQKTHLARLEHQLTIHSLQFERAEHRVNYLSNKEEGCGYDEMFEAEKFSNRLSQQTVKLLKEIQKAQKELTAAAKQPAENEIAGATSKPQAAPQLPSQSPQTAPAKDLAEVAAQEMNTGETNTEEANAVETSTEETIPTFQAADPVQEKALIHPPPSQQEYLHCIVKNRARIRATPAKDRQSLIHSLIEEHRAKTKPRAA